MHKTSNWSNIKCVKDHLKLSMVKCNQSGLISPRRFWNDKFQSGIMTAREAVLQEEKASVGHAH